jgi:hypothetical protein
MAGSEGIGGDLIRIRLFLVSYFPLWVMLAFRASPPGKWKFHPWHWQSRITLALIFAAVAIWALVDATRLIRGSKKTNPRTLTFGEINDQGGNAAGYLATYLLPFIGLIPADWGDWASYGVYFVVAAIVFIRTDLTFVNPTLYLLRYRVVSANAYVPGNQTPTSGSPFVIICKDPGVLTSPVEVTSIGGGYVVNRAPKASRGSGRAEVTPGTGGDTDAGGMGGD